MAGGAVQGQNGVPANLTSSALRGHLTAFFVQQGLQYLNEEYSCAPIQLWRHLYESHKLSLGIPNNMYGLMLTLCWEVG